MYENKTYENIMADMMASMPDDVNTREGSLIWNACSKQALQLEQAYLEMETVYDNMYTSTQDEDHLILNGADRGITIKEATAAVLKGQFSQEIEIGTRFNCGDLNYMCISNITGFDYMMQCEEAGAVGNNNLGELIAIDYVEDYQGGMLTELLAPGTEREDIEVYRQRLLSLNESKYFGGNRADYDRFICAIDGVGAVKTPRREEGDEYIYPLILAADFTAPSETLIEKVQTLVDPVTNHGEGEGIAPIGHKVLIKGVEYSVIDIVTTITYEDGYNQEALQSYINAVIDDYFLELAKEWSNVDSLIVRISQIESRLLKIKGIIDVTATQLNGTANNISIDYSHIPKRGRVNNV